MAEKEPFIILLQKKAAKLRTKHKDRKLLHSLLMAKTHEWQKWEENRSVSSQLEIFSVHRFRQNSFLYH